MAGPFDHIPEEVKRAAAEDAAPKTGGTKTAKRPPVDKPPTGGEKKQKRLFKYRRANTVLTEDQVKEIKAGRKKLRREMKQQHIYSKKEFELTASSLGLYFDKNKHPFLFWLWRHWLGALLGALAAFLSVMMVFAGVQRMRGHFTINMTDDMFREGFVLSETEDFLHPTTHLFSQPATDVPCVSIADLPKDIDQIDGSHNADYFAYTYYIRNEGENAVSYKWQVMLNSESKNLGVAAWVMVFEDGEMSFYARPSGSGGVEALPGFDDTRHGYIDPVLRQYLADPDQYQLVKTVGSVSYYRAVPKNYVSDVVIAEGEQKNIEPLGIHKYTVVIWLEGDDPDCTDELIGGHLGLEMGFRLIDEQGEETSQPWWKQFTGKLRFWNDSSE